ncbi:MAG: TonB-dependent receptor plug domain-containing protein [Syntrophobacteraceae bacterium]
MKSTIILLLLCSLLFCSSSNGFAQAPVPEDSESFTHGIITHGQDNQKHDETTRSKLDEVVVTATRLPTPSKELPVPTQVISKKEIAESRADDLSQLLIEKLPEHFQKYPGALTSISIRGFRSDTTGTDIKGRVLVLIDGHRAGTGNIAVIPLENVERIEIVRGPGSVVYGSAAMGGVVNIITRRGKGKPSGKAGTEYGSWDYAKGYAGLSSGLFDDRIGVSFTGRTIRQGSYDRGNGEKVPNTGYNDEAYSASLFAAPHPDHTLFAAGHFFRAWDVGSPEATYAQPSLDTTKDILRGYGSIDYDGSFPEREMNWRLSYFKVFDQSRWNDASADYGYSSSTTETRTQGTQTQFSLPTFSIGRLLLGFDWVGTDVGNSTQPAGFNWTPDSHYDNYAFFAEDTLHWNDLTLLAGIRYDLFHEEILSTPGLDVLSKSQEFQHPSWRTGLTYNFLDWLRGRAAVGTAFRAPTADELAGRFQMGSFSKIIGNPDLEPESGITYEAGLDFDRGGLSGGLGFFYTQYDNKISGGFPACVDGDCSWTTSRNVEGAVLGAFEGSLAYRKSLEFGHTTVNVRPFLNFVYYTTREIKDESFASILGSDTVPYVPMYDLTAGINISAGKLNLLFSGFYLGPEKQQNFNWLSPTYGKAIDTGDFAVLFAKLSYRPVKYLECFLAADNLTDRDYSLVDGYPMPGRTIRAGVEARF